MLHVGGDGSIRVGIFGGSHQVVFCHTDTISHSRGLIHLLVEVHLFDNGFHERTGVGLVVDGEVGIETNVVGLSPKDMREDGMESAHVDIACLWSDDGLDTLFHLLCRLVGEGEGEDVPWFHTFLADEIGNLVGEHSGLSRTGTRYNELRAIAVFYGGALTLIQFIQQIIIHS